MTSLRALFNVYKRGFTNHMQITSGVLQSDNMLSIGEFMTLLQHLGLFDAPSQLTPFAAKMIFKWSRIRTAAQLAVSRLKRELTVECGTGARDGSRPRRSSASTRV